jgi:hypothetical protein
MPAKEPARKCNRFFRWEAFCFHNTSHSIGIRFERLVNATTAIQSKPIAQSSAGILPAFRRMQAGSLRYLARQTRPVVFAKYGFRRLQDDET